MRISSRGAHNPSPNAALTRTQAAALSHNICHAGGAGATFAVAGAGDDARAAPVDDVESKSSTKVTSYFSSG